jgi:hypothetical protein
VSTTVDELRRLLTELDPAVRRQAWATLDEEFRDRQEAHKWVARGAENTPRRSLQLCLAGLCGGAAANA